MAGYGFNIGLDGHRVRPLTEQEKEEVAEGLVIIYSQAREHMLSAVARRLARGVTRRGWAERKSAEVLDAHNQLQMRMDAAARKREELLSDTMTRAYLSGSQKFYADMREILGNAAHISPNAQKAGYILSDLNNSLNAAERRILRQFDDQYADIIGAVSAKMATGVTTARQAVGEALQAFADHGITGFIDRGGHHWTLENYAEMAVLTAIERSTISGYVDTMQSYGYDLAVIDGHAGACPICAAWEGVIVSVSGENSDYPSLDDAEADGCFHPRCIHGITTYYDGISRAPDGGFRTEPREKEAPSISYTARSKQRYMERQIRKYKDRAIVAQTVHQKLEAKRKIQEWEDALDEFVKSRPKSDYLYRHRYREVGELGRNFSDVTNEYAAAAKPGAGTVTKEPGYKDKSKGHETAIAKEVLRVFGGDITHIDNSGRVTKPDITWEGKDWEIKNSSSETSVDTQIRKGLDQIHAYHGNLIIDNTGLAFARYQEIVFDRVRRSAKEDFDLAVFYEGEYVKTLRYKKR